MSWNAIYNNLSAALADQTETLARLQAQVASGMRLLRASDAPADAYRTLTLRAQSQSLETYAANLAEVVATREVSHSVLTEVSSTLATVREALTQVMSETYGEDTRAIVGEQIDAALDQVLSLANTRRLGQSLFGGSSTAAEPFLAERTGGAVTAVTYQGSLGNLDIPVAPGVTCTRTTSGMDAFYEHAREAPVFMGNTGAAPGQTTATVRGDVYLTAVNTLTSYAGASGLAAGTGTDTLLGDHVLTVVTVGPDSTLSLDGGPAVAFQGTETDLAVTGPDGAVVHVDVTGWGGFTGDVTVTGTGKLSIDDGATYTDLPALTDNVAVTDSRTGGVLYVDTTGMLRTGVEPVRVPGTHDLFAALINIRDVLQNDRGLTASQQSELMDQGLEALDRVADVVLHEITAAGARLQAMDTLGESMSAVQTLADTQASELEQADIVQVASDLTRTQTLYEMTLAVTAKLLDLSLLDFI